MTTNENLKEMIMLSTYAVAEALTMLEEKIQGKLDSLQGKLQLLVDTPETKAEALWAARKILWASFFPSFFLSFFIISFFLSFLFSFFPFLFLSLAFFLSSSQEFKRAGLRLFLTNFPSVWSSGVVGEEFRALSLSSVKLLLHDETVDTQVEVEKKLWVRFFNSISLLLLSDGLLFSLLFSSLLFQTWIETLRENALRSTSGGEQRKSLSTLFAEGKAQWTNDGQTWDKNWFETEGVDNLCDLLSQYFRKYVKQSDAVPEDIESLIRGSFFFSFFVFCLFCFVLFSYSFFFFFFFLFS